MTSPDSRLAPVKRGRGQVASGAPDAASEPDDSDVLRGQAAAVLGALGRMQLRLDVMAREQSEALARVTLLLEDVEARLGRLESGRPDPGAPAGP